MHPSRKKRVKLEGLKKNYRSVIEIEEELKNVDLENFLEFDLNGK